MPMSYFGQRRVVLFDGASANSSGYTSGSQFVGDYAEMILQVDVLNSRLTLSGSNDDGLRSSINTWSTITGIVTAGLYDVTTGFRWLRAARSSADSLNVVALQGKYQG